MNTYFKRDYILSRHNVDVFTTQWLTPDLLGLPPPGLHKVAIHALIHRKIVQQKRHFLNMLAREVGWCAKEEATHAAERPAEGLVGKRHTTRQRKHAYPAPSMAVSVMFEVRK